MKEIKEVNFKMSEEDLQVAKDIQSQFINGIEGFDELNLLQKRHTNSHGALNALLTVAIRDGLLQFKMTPKLGSLLPSGNLSPRSISQVKVEDIPRDPDLFHVEMCCSTDNYNGIILNGKLSELGSTDIKVIKHDNGDLVLDFTQSMDNLSFKLKILFSLKKWWPDYVKTCATALVDPDPLVSDYTLITDHDYMTFERESENAECVTYRSNYYCKVDNKFNVRVGLTSEDVMRILNQAYHRA